MLKSFDGKTNSRNNVINYNISNFMERSSFAGFVFGR